MLIICSTKSLYCHCTKSNYKITVWGRFNINYFSVFLLTKSKCTYSLFYFIYFTLQMTLPKNQTKPKIVGLTLHYCVFSDFFFKSLPLCSEQFFFDLNDKIIYYNFEKYESFSSSWKECSLKGSLFCTGLSKIMILNQFWKLINSSNFKTDLWKLYCGLKLKFFFLMKLWVL